MRFLSILLLFVFNLFSQSLSMRTFSTKDGLHPFPVERRCEDSLGNLWMGTAGGLPMYNGKRIQVWTTDEGLPRGNIRTVYFTKYSPVNCRSTAKMKWRSSMPFSIMSRKSHPRLIRNTTLQGTTSS